MLDNKNNKYYGVDSGCGSPQNWGNLQSAYSLRSHQSWWTSKGVKGAVLGLGLATLLPITNAFGADAPKTPVTLKWADGAPSTGFVDKSTITLDYGVEVLKSTVSDFIVAYDGNTEVPGTILIDIPLYTGDVKHQGAPWSNVNAYPANNSVDPLYENVITFTFTPTDAKKYAPAKVVCSLKVNQIPPSVTWAYPTGDVTYGDPNPLKPLATVAGDAAYGNPLEGIFDYYVDGKKVFYTINQSTDQKWVVEESKIINELLTAGPHTVKVTWTPQKEVVVNNATIRVNTDDANNYLSNSAKNSVEKSLTVKTKALSSDEFSWNNGNGGTEGTDPNKYQVFNITYGDEFSRTLISSGTFITKDGAKYETSVPSGKTNPKVNVGDHPEVGTYYLNVTFSYPNYTSQTQKIKLVVGKANPTITWGQFPSEILEGTPMNIWPGTPAQVFDKVDATKELKGTLAYYYDDDNDPTTDSRRVEENFPLPYVQGGTPIEARFTIDATDAFNKKNYNVGQTITSTITLNVYQKKATEISWTPDTRSIEYGTALKLGDVLNATMVTIDPKTGKPVDGQFIYVPEEGSVPQAIPFEDVFEQFYTLNVTFKPTDNAHYAESTATITLTVDQVYPTLTWNPSVIPYGTKTTLNYLKALLAQPGAVSFTHGIESYNKDTGEVTIVAETVEGTVEYTFDPRLVDKTPAEGTDYYVDIKFTPSNEADADGNRYYTRNYLPLSKREYLVVGKFACPIIDWNPSNMTFPYGTVLGEDQENAWKVVDAKGNTHNLKPGTYDTGKKDNDGNPIYGTDPFGTITYQLWSGDAAVNDDGTQIIGTRTNPDGSVISPTLLITATDVLDGFVAVPAHQNYDNNGNPLDDNNYQLVAVFTPADTENYATTYAARTLVVDQATPTITWSMVTPITYGTDVTAAAQLNATFSWSVQSRAKSWREGGEVTTTTVTVAGTPAYKNAKKETFAEGKYNAGSYTAYLTFSPTDTVNYTTATAEKTLVVEPAPLKLVVADVSISSGEDAPVFDDNSYDMRGFVYAETPTSVFGNTKPVLTTTYTKGKDNGKYPITVSNKSALNAAAPNYAIEYIEGTLFVGVKSSVRWLKKPDPIAEDFKLTFDPKQGKNGPAPLNAQAFDDQGNEIINKGTYTYTANDNTDPIESGKTTLPPGANTLNVTWTPDDGQYYTAATAKVDIWVRDVPEIKWTDPEVQYIPENAVYLTDDLVKGATKVLKYGGDEITDKGTLTWEPTDANVRKGDRLYASKSPYHLTLKFVPTDKVTYTDDVVANVVLTVKPVAAPAEVAWTPTYQYKPAYAQGALVPYVYYGADITAKNYLNAVVTYTYTYKDGQETKTQTVVGTSDNGEYVYTFDTKPTVGTGEDGLTITMKFTPNEKNFAEATATINVDVLGPALTIAWKDKTGKPVAVANSPQLEITYDEALTSAQFQLSATISENQDPEAGTLVTGTKVAGTVKDETVVGKTETGKAIGAQLDAGSYTLSATFTPNDKNYKEYKNNEASLTVKRAGSTVIPSSDSRYTIEYGEYIDPEPTVTGKDSQKTDLTEKGGFTYTVSEYTENFFGYVSEGKVYESYTYDASTGKYTYNNEKKYTVGDKSYSYNAEAATAEQDGILYQGDTRIGFTVLTSDNDVPVTEAWTVTYEPMDDGNGLIDPTTTQLDVLVTEDSYWAQYHVQITFTPNPVNNFDGSTTEVELDITPTDKWTLDTSALDGVIYKNWTATPAEYIALMEPKVIATSGVVIVGTTQRQKIGPDGEPEVDEYDNPIMEDVDVYENIIDQLKLTFIVDGYDLNEYPRDFLPLGTHTLTVVADPNVINYKQYHNYKSHTNEGLTFEVKDPSQDPATKNEVVITSQNQDWLNPWNLEYGFAPLYVVAKNQHIERALNAIAKDKNMGEVISDATVADEYENWTYELAYIKPDGSKVKTIITEQTIIDDLRIGHYILTATYTDPYGFYGATSKEFHLYVNAITTKTILDYAEWWYSSSYMPGESAPYGSTLRMYAYGRYQDANGRWRDFVWSPDAMLEFHANKGGKVKYDDEKDVWTITGGKDTVIDGNTHLTVGTYWVYAKYLGYEADEDIVYAPSISAPVKRIVTAGKPSELSWNPEAMTYGDPVGPGQKNAVAIGIDGKDISDNGAAFIYPEKWPTLAGKFGVVAAFQPSNKNYQTNVVEAELLIKPALPTVTWGENNVITLPFGTEAGAAQKCVKVMGVADDGDVTKDFTIPYEEVFNEENGYGAKLARGEYPLELTLTSNSQNYADKDKDGNPLKATTLLKVVANKPADLTFWMTPVVKDDDSAVVTAADDTAAGTPAAETEAGAPIGDKLTLSYGRTLGPIVDENGVVDPVKLGVYQLPKIELADDNNDDDDPENSDAEDNDEGNSEDEEEEAEPQAELVATIIVKAKDVDGENLTAKSIAYELTEVLTSEDEKAESFTPDSRLLPINTTYTLSAIFTPEDPDYGSDDAAILVEVVLGEDTTAVEVDWDINDSHYARTYQEGYTWAEVAPKDAKAYNIYLDAEDPAKLLALDDPTPDSEEYENQGKPEKGCDNLTYSIVTVPDKFTADDIRALEDSEEWEDLSLEERLAKIELTLADLEEYDPYAEDQEGNLPLVEVGIYYLVAEYTNATYGYDFGDDFVVIAEPWVEWEWQENIKAYDDDNGPMEYGTHLSDGDIVDKYPKNHLCATFFFADLELPTVNVVNIEDLDPEDMEDGVIYVAYHDYDRILPVGKNTIRADWIMKGMTEPQMISATSTVVKAYPLILSNDGTISVVEDEEGEYLLLTVDGGTIFTGATAWAIDGMTLVDGIFTEGYIKNGEIVEKVIENGEILADVELVDEDVITLHFEPQGDAIPNYNPVDVEWVVGTETVKVTVTAIVNGTPIFGQNVTPFLGFKATEGVAPKIKDVEPAEVVYLIDDATGAPAAIIDDLDPECYLPGGIYSVRVIFYAAETARYGEDPYVSDRAELVVAQADQVIDIPQDEYEMYNEATVILDATATSGEPVEFEVEEGAEDILVPTGNYGEFLAQNVENEPVTVTVTVSQPGNSDYKPAEPQEIYVTINPLMIVTVEVPDVEITYGDSKPEQSAYDGWTSSVELKGTPIFDVKDYEAGDDADAYEIYIANEDAVLPDGYNKAKVIGSLIVNPALATVEAIVPEEALTYGVDLVELIRAEEPTISYTATATVAGEEVDLTGEGTVIYVVTSIDSEGEIEVIEIDPLDPAQVPVVLDASETAYGLTVEFTPFSTNFEAEPSEMADLYVDPAEVIITPDDERVNYPAKPKLTGYTVVPENAPVVKDSVVLEAVDYMGYPGEYDIVVAEAQIQDQNPNYVLNLEDQGIGTLTVLGNPENEVIFWTVPSTITYGTKIALNAKVVDRQTGKVLAQNDELLYSWYDATSAVDQGIELTADTILDAGEYYLSAYWEADGVVYADTYIWLPVTVTKAQAELTLTADPAALNVGQTTVITMTATGDEEPEIISIEGDALEPVLGAELTFEAVKEGTTTFTAAVAETDNYLGAEATVTVTVSPKPVLTVIATADPIVYGQEAKYNAVWDLTDVDIKVTVSSEYDTNPAAKTYDLNVVVEGAEAYNVDIQAGKLVVSPAELLLTVKDSKIYDGKALETTDVEAKGLQFNDTVTAGAAATTGTDAGTYIYALGAEKMAQITTPYATANGIENYEVIYDIALTIDQELVTVEATIEEPIEYVYGIDLVDVLANAIVFIAEPENSVEAITAYVVADEDGEVVAKFDLADPDQEPVILDAGDYTLTPVVIPVSDNYLVDLVPSVDVIVEKADPEFEAWAEPETLVEGDTLAISWESLSAGAVEVIEYSENLLPSNEAKTEFKAIAAGEAFVVLEQAATDNYLGDAAKVTVEIGFKPIIPVTITVDPDQSVTFGEALPVLTATMEPAGAPVTYQVVAPKYEAGKTGVKDNVIITAIYDDVEGYSVTVIDNLLTVTPAAQKVTLTVEPPTLKVGETAKISASSDKQQDVTITISDTSILSENGVALKEGTVTITAIADQNDNYEVAKDTATVTVTKKDPIPVKLTAGVIQNPIVYGQKYVGDIYFTAVDVNGAGVAGKASWTVIDKKTGEVVSTFNPPALPDVEILNAGDYTLTVDFTPDSSAYAKPADAYTDLTVEQAYVNVTVVIAKDGEITDSMTTGDNIIDYLDYTTDPEGLTGTIVYGVYDENEELVAEVDPEEDKYQTLPVGTYTVEPLIFLADDSNYRFGTYEAATLNVEPIDVTVTAYVAEGMTAGDNIANFLDYTAVDPDGEAVAGSIYYLVFTKDDPLHPVITVDPEEDLYQTLPAGVYDVEPSFLPDDYISYQVDEVIGDTLIVEEIPVTVSIEWIVPEEIVYGTAIALNAKVYVDGEEVENPVVEYYLDNEDTPLGEGWILPVDTYQVKAVFIAPLGADYSGAETAWMPVAVTPKALTVTLDDAEVVYGEDLVLPEVEIEGLLEGDSVTYDVTSIYHAGTTSAGTYKDGIIATLSEDSDNYEAPAQVTSTLTVKKATQEVILVVNPTVLNVGDSATATVVTTSGLTDFTLVISDPSILSPNLVALKVGTVTVTAKQAGDKNYEPAESNTVEVTVAPKAEVQITWEPKSPITYGTILSAEHLNATAELDGKKVEGHFYYNPTFGYVVTPESPFVVNGKLRLSATFIPTDRKRYKNAYVEVLVDIVVEEDDTTDDGEDAPTLTISKAGSVKGMVNAAADALVITFTGTLEESTDGVTWTPVADAKDGTYVVDVKVASKKFYRSAK